MVYSGFRATLVSYIVDLGRFRFTINVLNLPGNTLCRSEDYVSNGAFGEVVTKRIGDKVFVAKVMKRGGPKALEETICEVAIAKLCALFEIGPDLETSIPFDMIVYDNSVQFHLEQCERISTCEIRGFINMDLAKRGRFESDLKYCIGILHSLHIAHNDIKPDNILWSSRLNRFVLCDFGVAGYVREKVGGVSKTGCVGTPAFMGPEMRERR